jgi:hypothetical protein
MIPTNTATKCFGFFQDFAGAGVSGLTVTIDNPTKPWADCPLCHSSDVHILKNQTYTDNLVLQCDGCETRFEMDTPNIVEARERWNGRDWKRRIKNEVTL